MPSGRITAPLAVFKSAAAMPVFLDAAAFSVSRAMAPARRNLSKLSGVELDPPVACTPITLTTAPSAPRTAAAVVLSSEARKGA